MRDSTKVPPNRRPILAIDLGKFRCTACLYWKEDAEFEIASFPTGREELLGLLERRQPRVVVVEACLLAGWVYDACRSAEVACKVANTASEQWRFKHTKRKTDKDDALRLAQLEALGQLPTVTMPTTDVRQWRQLIAARQRLVGRRVAVQNRLRAILVGQGLPAPVGAKAWTAAGMGEFVAKSKPLAECADDGLWRGLLAMALEEYRHIESQVKILETRLDAIAESHVSVTLLTSIPGVGVRTAEAVVACLGDAARFASAKEVGAFAGLVPRQYQSGEVDRRGRITKRGPSLLRKLLVQCAWAMLHYNAWAQEVFARLSKGGKTRRKAAIVALARKLLIVCWAMLKRQKTWREPKAKAAPAA